MLFILDSEFCCFTKEAGFPIDNRGTGARVYTKEKVLKMLVRITSYIRPLTKRELKSINEYPSISEILVLFKTTRMEKVWKEVSIEAMKVLREKANNKRQNYEAVIAGKKGERNVAHNLEFLDKKQIYCLMISLYMTKIISYHSKLTILLLDLAVLLH